MGCTKRVRETLLTLENVAAVEVDFAKKTAAITMKGGASLAKDTVVSALKAKNYEVTAFECREPRAEAVFIAGIGGMK